jgi:hypothetical protein
MATQAQDFEDVRRRAGDRVVRDSVLGAKPFAPVEATKLKATPYVCVDPQTIPLRPWVYGRQLLRGSLSLVVAPGATGKTALLAGIALALTTGRALLDKQVWDGPKRVWLWNLEDSSEELSRLIEAARLHWNISADDIGGRLFVDSALSGADLKMAVEDREGFKIIRPVIEALVAELREREIDVLIVDPFVSSHSVSENDNGAIDAIAKEWARVGVRANCSVVLVHHTRKLGGGEATAEGARGAIALVGAARSVVALNKMTPEEAKQFGIDGEERRRFVRGYDDKNNRTPPASASDWFQLLSVDLGNGGDDRPGDNLPVAVPWQCPDAFTGITSADLLRVQEAVAEGSWKFSDQAKGWVGEAVAKALGLDVDADAARIKKLLREWIANGLLVKVERMCPSARRLKPFVEPGEPVEL